MFSLICHFILVIIIHVIVYNHIMSRQKFCVSAIAIGIISLGFSFAMQYFPNHAMQVGNIVN